MNPFLRPLLYSFLFLALSCQNQKARFLASDHHISSSAHQLVSWETRANAISERSDELIRLEHYEIPLRLLQKDFDGSLDPKIRESLLFEKNGETFVRWPINPEDSTWHLEIKEFLKKHRLDSEPKKFFDAYLTASRSMILVNPHTGATFSLKVSTDKTGGMWKDKKQTWKDAQQVRKMNKYVKASLSEVENETLVIMEEPLALGILDLDQGLLVRSLNDLPEDTHYYLPAFSALHEKEGARIARMNGSSDPAAFWDKHLVQPLGKAMAEYFSATGAWYDSPHAQNFLIELDKDMKPTGKIIFRDLGDSYLLEDFVKNTKFAWIMKNWEEGKVVSGKMPTAIGLTYGNRPPKWLSGLESKEYGWNFYRVFEKKLSELSGIPLTELSRLDSREVVFEYTKKVYLTTSESWKRFSRYASCMGGEAFTLLGEKCPESLTKRHLKIDCAKAVRNIIAP